ncbi:MAG: type II and III secretion system protein [Verrucomicrobia bacterium]|nr:type II and III secretion system protein [Verrucomicrobiota bacterium]
MLIFKPSKWIRPLVAWCLAACLSGSLYAGGAGGSGDAGAREQARRAAAVQEAQELLLKGDEAYAAGKFAEAVVAFAGARELFPDAPQTAELRTAATDRYAQAAVEQGKNLSRKGDMDGAKALLDKVLAEGVAPRHAGALAFRAQLDDPIRSNPALNADHAKDVDEVRRLLYTAQGAFDLGKFDEALQRYEEVLRIDPTNSAARRGMEKTAAAKSGYAKAAYDDTRAEMLGQVDGSWETQVPAPEQGLGPLDGGAPAAAMDEVSLKAKLDQIIIPSIALEQSSLDEALDFLRLKAAENDTVELDAARKGVNFTVNLGAADSEAAKRIRALRFDLRLSQVPLSKALRYLTDITQTEYKTDEFSVLIAPLGFSSDDLVVRSYRVPPDFLTSLNSAAGAGGEKTAADPFAEAPEKGGLLTARLSTQESLAKQCVPFPQGASAHYSPATNALRIVNTEVNQETIAQIIDAMSQIEPVAVAVKVTMIRTQQSNLEELGFDWLLNGAGSIENSGVAAGGGTVGNGTPRTATDFTGENIGDPEGIMTAGLRSGDGAISNNSIDALIANPDRTSQAINVAPGVLSVTGVFGDAQFKSIMRGLDRKKGIDIMARPSVVTRSGQASSIAVIREFIYPTEYEPPEIPQSVGEGAGITPVTPATPTAFEKRDVGITLEVLPVADANKRFVDVTLNPSFVEFDGFVNYGSPIRAGTNVLGAEPLELTKNAILMPVFSAQKLATQLTVADGATIVIGGLMTESVKNVEDKVPVLGGLPVVGRMFSSKSRESVSTALIFLVNIELIDPTGRPYRDR